MMRTGSLVKRKASPRTPVKAKRPTKRFKPESRGQVASRSTTLATAPTPFPATRYITFDYSNGLFYRAPASNTDVISFQPNNMVDFDSNVGAPLGNKQPLYFDALLSVTGPYRYFKVLSWVTVFTIVNRGTAPITAWVTNTPLAADADTVAEIDNLPGVVKKFIDVPGGQSLVSIKHTGNLKDYSSSFMSDIQNTGTYNTGPVNVINGNLVLFSSSTLIYEIAVKHLAYTQLLLVDAVAS